jgi:hypothetical protein
LNAGPPPPPPPPAFLLRLSIIPTVMELGMMVDATLGSP